LEPQKKLANLPPPNTRLLYGLESFATAKEGGKKTGPGRDVPAGGGETLEDGRPHGAAATVVLILRRICESDEHAAGTCAGGRKHPKNVDDLRRAEANRQGLGPRRGHEVGGGKLADAAEADVRDGRGDGPVPLGCRGQEGDHLPGGCRARGPEEREEGGGRRPVRGALDGFVKSRGGKGLPWTACHGTYLYLPPQGSWLQPQRRGPSGRPPSWGADR